MSDISDRAEMRKQNRLEKLGTNDPVCPLCGISDWRCFELHHVAGRKFDDQEIAICLNCHAVCSDLQKNHPARLGRSPTMLEAIGRYLLGLADMLGAVAAKLKEFGLFLIAEAQRALAASREAVI